MGRQPAGNNVATVSTKTDPLRPGAERLTIEAHEAQTQHIQFIEDCHVGWNRPTQLVGAKREYFEIHEGREQLKCLGKRWSCASQHILSRKD